MLLIFSEVDATLEILDCIGKLELKIDIAEAQNYFFTKVIANIEELIQSMSCVLLIESWLQCSSRLVKI